MSLKRKNRKYVHLSDSWTWSRSQYARQIVYLQCHFPRFQAAFKSVNMICHSSHCIKTQVNNLGQTGPPPACTKGFQSSLMKLENTLFCTHTPHRYCHWSYFCACEGVHSSMDANNAKRSLCMQEGQKYIKIEKQTYAEINVHMHKKHRVTNKCQQS